MRKFLAYVLLMVTTIFFAACSNEPPVDVKVAEVISADETLTITHDGKISFSYEQKLLSPVSGNVVTTYFEHGEQVAEGQPLFKIGNAKDETELRKARAALGESMTALAREIAEKNPAAADRQAEVDERRAIVQSLEETSKAGIVNAPRAGQIGTETAQLGAQVTAGETVLATIGTSNPVVVRFEVAAEEKHLLTSSDALKIRLRLTDGTTYQGAGHLKFADATTVEAAFDNADDSLTVGRAAQIVIDGLKIPKVLLVPESAVQHRDGGDFVFVVDSNKRAALKKFSQGGKLGKYIIVNDGLKAGERVVVEGLTNLREGMPLKIGD